MDRYCTDGWIVAFYIVALDLISHVLGTDICRWLYWVIEEAAKSKCQR